jgi:hypothetical protein
MVAAMIEAADVEHQPNRLLLGSNAYRLVHNALTERLVFVEVQHDLAASTDADNYTPSAA